MLSGLESVEKVPFRTFAWAFVPIFLEVGLPRPRLSRTFLHIPSRAVSRFSRGPVAGNHPSARFRSNWVKYDYYSLRSDRKNKGTKKIRSGTGIVFDPVGSKKFWRWFSATGRREKWATALDRSWRKLRLSLRRGSPTSNIHGSKALKNVLKYAFSTDCKSGCIRIGLRPFPMRIRFYSVRFWLFFACMFVFDR